MILIAHRGNLNGPNKEEENKPEYIDDAIAKGYDCEIDIWGQEDGIYLGHDKPTYKMSLKNMGDWQKHIWIHIKNISAMERFVSFKSISNHNFFWHHEDLFTFTSSGDLWCYPSKTIYKNGINVLPELNNLKKEDLKDVYGVCSDYIEDYK